MLLGSPIKFDFDTGAAAGDLEQITLLDPFDLSHSKGADVVVSLTTADAAADDTFDLFFEETFDGVTWDQRLHSHQFTGAMTASAAAPEVRRYRVMTYQDLNTSDTAYETTGSAGASALAAGTVRHGPFAGKRYVAVEPFGLAPTHRLRFVTGDADDDARFSGSVTLTLHSPL